ncbi:uncharacterized protein LOC134797322 [Cydia splendana]|uniref:uncharacterized protein LOC134797322 n=1 Tax=Cydia splendana TaxID=1100963 RepID=UPI00300DA9EC
MNEKFYDTGLCCGYDWDKIRCSKDWAPVEPGLQPPDQIGRFPWLGVIQHDFYSADTMRYSITGAVLIHPEYALASAEDMAKIDKDIVRNSTYFMVWYSSVVKYTMGVEDYKLNQEYETMTYATTALVKIVRDRTIELGDPENGEFQKEVSTMDIVDVKNCDLYDEKAEPELKMLVPTYPICATAQGVDFTCFMDSGAVLVSRDSNEFWTLTLPFEPASEEGDLVTFKRISNAVKWDKVKCSVDRAPIVEGVLSPDQMGRFPWLGVIQHDFYLYGKKRTFSVTGAVRIHVSYALAPAEDMAMINRKTISNTTHFIVWHSANLKYSIGVEDYIMHPEYEDRKTYATTALVELMIVESNQVGHPAPVLPICLPAKNHPSYDKIYVVKMTTGDDGQILKEIISMIAIDNKDCDMFYEKAELDFKMMLPSQPICAATLEQQPACIWDGGAVLVTREPDSYWTLLGFGVRGPGCGAPARFVDVKSQLFWIDPQVSATT